MLTCCASRSSKAFIAPCPGLDEYPGKDNETYCDKFITFSLTIISMFSDDLWKNVNFQGLSYEERVCCEVGTGAVSEQCPKLDEVRDTVLPDSAIFGIIFGSLAVLEMIGCYFCFYYKKKASQRE